MSYLGKCKGDDAPKTDEQTEKNANFIKTSKRVKKIKSHLNGHDEENYKMWQESFSKPEKFKEETSFSQIDSLEYGPFETM